MAEHLLFDTKERILSLLRSLLYLIGNDGDTRGYIHVKNISETYTYTFRNALSL